MPSDLRQRPIARLFVAVAAQARDLGQHAVFRRERQRTSGRSARRAHGLTRKRVWPNSTVSPLLTSTLAMVPRVSALMLLKTFIASMMQTSVSSSTVEPTWTNGLASGDEEE